MDEVLAQDATRPATTEKRLIAVEPFLADRAIPGFNPQQHGLPRSAAFSDTHAMEYSEGARREARGAEVMKILISHFSPFTPYDSWFDTSQGRLLPSARISVYPQQAEPP